MDLTFKPTSSVTLVFLLFFSILEASENKLFQIVQRIKSKNCLLYTSDAADE